MLVSLKWLSDYVDIQDMTPEAVAQALTDIGLEVESIAKASAVPPEVIVGQIVTAVQHPNADSLRLCTVNVGQGEPLAIVCGAPNARVGIKVAVATIGAVLPGNFKIKKSKIRGEESHGMLCSEKELTISDESNGIIELPESAVLGQPLAKAMGLDDTTVEIKITPNRPDCLGYVGLARDLAAKLKRTFKEPVPEVARDPHLATASQITIETEGEEACARFVALYVSGVSPTPSPAWLQKRLTASGMRPINLIVDATNYVMLEYSQPVHAYDVRSIRGKKLIARSATTGETVKTLDGQLRQLSPEDIVIADGEGPVGLAGVMGGEASEVRSDTSEIVIEVASFPPRRVRRTSRRLGLHTEASHRFERGIDVDSLPRVAWRVAEIIARGALETGSPKPKIAGDLIDVYPAEVQKRVISLRLSHVKKILAQTVLLKDDVVKILESLEFTLLDANEDRLVFEVPFFRIDIEREADLVEEVARLIGYDKIPYQLPVMNIRPTPEDPFIEFQEDVRVSLALAGLRETISFPFISPETYALLGLEGDHPLAPSLTLKNPLSEQNRAMQTTLVPNLLRAAGANRRRGECGVRLFECGRGYFRGGLAMPASPFWKSLTRPSRHVAALARGDAGRPTERHWVAGVLDQPFLEKSWDGPETAVGFHQGKGIVLTLLRAMGVPEPEFRRIDAKDLPFLHPGAAATIYAGGKVVGYAGELHPKVAMALDLSPEHPPVVFEMDLETVFTLKGTGLKLKSEPQKFPPVTRDIALLLDVAKTHGDFEAAMRGFKKKQHLSRFRLFDVFQGDKLPPGKKSVAYTISFQSAERTLTDQDVEPEIQALLAWLGEALGAEQR